jgi:hypothetical protein
MSHWGDDITQELGHNTKDRRITVFYQEDQAGYPFVRLQYVDWEWSKEWNDYVATTKNLAISKKEAIEMIEELAVAAERIKE